MYLCPNICRRFIYCCTINAIVELILKMTLSISCYLCFSSGLTFKCLLDDNGKFNNIYEIAVKYFKPELSKSQEKLSSAVICQKCWDHINEFYNFQQLIRSTQSQIKKCIPIIRIYQREHNLNYVSSPIQLLNLSSTTLDHENSEIYTNKVVLSVSPTPVAFRPTHLKQSNNVHISKNSNLTSTGGTEKESKKIAHRYWISAKKEGFQCDSCHIKFNYTTQLKHHMKIYHNIFLRSPKVYCRCEICKNLTFSCFDNLITHMRRRHHIFLILRKYESFKCENFKQSYDAAWPQLVPLTTTVDQSGHVNPNDDPKLEPLSNNSLIKEPTENHSLPAINADKATSELLMEDTKIKKAQSTKVDDKPLVQLPTFLKQSVHLKPNDEAKLVPDSNYSTIKATKNQALPAINVVKATAELLMEDTRITTQSMQNSTEFQSVKPFKGEMNVDGKLICPICKHLTFSNFYNLKRHMKSMHNIVNFINTFKRSKQMQAAKDYVAQHQQFVPLTTSLEQSGHVKPKEDFSNNAIINPNVNQSIITFNPMANVNKTTLELILEDKTKGIQQIDISEVDKIQKNTNIKLSNNNGQLQSSNTTIFSPGNGNAGIIAKDTYSLKSHIPVTQTHSLEPSVDAELVANIGDINKINKNCAMMKPNEDQSLEPHKIEIKNVTGSNNTIINSTENQSTLSINSIANIDASTSELIMEEKIKTIQQIESCEDAEVVANVGDIVNNKLNSSMMKPNEDQSLEPLKIKIKIYKKDLNPITKKKIENYRCEKCKHLTFYSFRVLKKHMKMKHQIVNIKINKKSKKTAGNKNYNFQFQTLTTSPQADHAEPNDNDKLEPISNCTIIKETQNQSLPAINSYIQSVKPFKFKINVDGRFICEMCKNIAFSKFSNLKRHMNEKHEIINTNVNQSIITFNPIANVNKATSELILEDKIKGIQQIDPSEVDKIQKNINIILSNNNGPGNGNAGIITKDSYRLKSHIPVTQTHRLEPSDDAEVVANVGDINKNCAMMKPNEDQSLEPHKIEIKNNKKPFKCEMNIDGKFKCEMCKYFTFANFYNFKRHMESKHNIGNFINKFQHIKKILAAKDSEAPHQQLVTLTTSPEQSGHVKPNEGDKLVNGSNNTIINSTANQSMLSINSIANVDTSTSELTMEETMLEIDPPEEYNSTMKKTFRCEMCKYLTFANFYNLKRHMEKKHHIFNVRNMYRISKKRQATKDSDAPHLQLVTSNTSPEQAGHAKSNEDAKLVNGSNNSIINSTENQSILSINPIANVDTSTSELIMEDKRKTIQQIHPSEVDKIDFVSPIRDNKNIQLNSNTGQLESVNSTTSSLENENAGIITRDTDRLKSPISVKQANLMKPNEIQSLEPLKINIKIKKNILKPLTTKKIENYRCKKCKHLTFSYFWVLKRHMKMKHQIVNFQNKYKKSKKAADRGKPNQDAELLANGVTINKKCNYNLRNKNHQMDNCVKVYKKCETQATDDPDLPLQQLNASTKSLQRSDICKLSGDADVVNINKKCNSAVQNQKKLQAKNYLQYDQVENLELNTLNSKDSDAPHLQLVTLTTSPEQSGHVKPNEDDKLVNGCNNTIINSTANQSMLSINSIENVDTSTSELIMVDSPTINPNIKYNSTMKKTTDIQSVKPIKCKINVDGRFICEMCKNLAFSKFSNLKRHMNENHHIFNLQNKYKISQKIQAAKDSDAPHQQLVTLTTSPEQSGVKLNEDFSNNAIINPTVNQSIITSNPIANVNKATSELILEDEIKGIQQIDPSEVDKIQKNINIKLSNNNGQLQSSNSTISSPGNGNSGIITKDSYRLKSHISVTQIHRLEPSDDAEVIANVGDINKNCTMMKPNEDQSLEPHKIEIKNNKKPFKCEMNIDGKFKCEMCKYYTFANFSNLKRHMEKKHHIFNVRNKYKISKKIQATKGSDAPHQQLVTSNTSPEQAGHAKSNEDAKLVNGGNNSIINSTENQSILSINPIANVDTYTSELIMEDKRKTIQQIHPSEVDKIDFVSPIRDNKNIQLSSNTGQLESVNSPTSSLENENAGIISRDTDRLKSPISVTQANLMKPNEIQSLEPLKINIKIDKNILKPLTTKKIENYRCKKCKHLTFSYFWVLKRHMKMKHQIVNFQNKYKKSKKAAQDTEFLANGVTINKNCNYNLRNKKHQMDNCVKVYKKCETQATDDADLPLQQLNASTKSLQQSDICKLNGDTDVVHNVVNINKKCNSAVQNQKKLGIQPKNYLQYDPVENLELNTLKKKNTKPKKTFLPDGIDNFIKMSIGDLKCTICERTFGYYSLLSEHFKLKHPNKKCFVNCCGNEVINRRNLVQHLKRHRVAARMSNGEESKKGNNKYSTTSRSYMTNKSSYIIQADPVLAITSVISANPIESVNVTSTDQSIPSTSVSSRATTLSKSQLKQCNYCSRTFKYVTSLMKHINKCQFYMRNYCNLNQNTDNRNLCIKSENDFLNTNLNAEDSELNQFQEIKTEIPYILVTPNISVPPLDIVDIKEDINFD